MKTGLVDGWSITFAKLFESLTSSLRCGSDIYVLGWQDRCKANVTVTVALGLVPLERIQHGLPSESSGRENEALTLAVGGPLFFARAKVFLGSLGE